MSVVVSDGCCGFTLLGYDCRYLDVLVTCIWRLQVFVWSIGVEVAAWPIADAVGAFWVVVAGTHGIVWQFSHS